MKTALSALAACAAIGAASPSLAGDLVIFSINAPANYYSNPGIALPGSGRYLIEFSGPSNSVFGVQGSFEVEWDTYLGEGCVGYCYVEGNESESNESFGGFGPEYSYVFVVPEPIYSAAPVGPGNPYGVPPETLIIFEEIYINARLNVLTEILSETPDLDATFTLTVKQLGAVPEPQTWALLILGFGAAGAMLRRRQVCVT